MFYFRLNKLKIFNNRESRFLGVFGRDSAEVKIISFVTCDGIELPDMSKFMKAIEPAQKEAMLKETVQQVIGSRILTEIENVKDGHIMTFGDTGYVLFESKNIPNNFDWQFIAYESDQKVRDNAQLVTDVVSDKEFGSFTKNLGSLLKSVPDPGYAAAVAISKYTIDVIGKTAKKTKDDMIGMLYMSLNRGEHYKHGIRNVQDVPDLTNNMMIDYSIFGFEEKEPKKKKKKGAKVEA